YWGWGANSVMKIDPTTYQDDPISSIAQGETVYFSNPQGLTIDRETHRVFVTNRGAGADFVTVIDGNDQQVIGRIPVGRTVISLIIDKATDYMYAVSSADNLVT